MAVNCDTLSDWRRSNYRASHLRPVVLSCCIDKRDEKAKGLLERPSLSKPGKLKNSGRCEPVCSYLDNRSREMLLGNEFVEIGAVEEKKRSYGHGRSRCRYFPRDEGVYTFRDWRPTFSLVSGASVYSSKGKSH